MKNKQLNIMILALAVLMIAGTNARAQRGFSGGSGYSCCMNIPDLTENQKAEISRMEQQHRKEMDAMRTGWRQSAAYSARENHLAEVDKKVEAHRKAVRSLLTEEQQALFDNMQGRAGRNRAVCMGRGMGRFAGEREAGYCCGGRFGRGWSKTTN